jgi:hypothetical protein
VAQASAEGLQLVHQFHIPEVGPQAHGLGVDGLDPGSLVFGESTSGGSTFSNLAGLVRPAAMVSRMACFSMGSSFQRDSDTCVYKRPGFPLADSHGWACGLGHHHHRPADRLDGEQPQATAED